MRRFCLASFLAVSQIVSAYSVSFKAADQCGDGRQCLAITDCEEFQSAAAVRLRRPKPCGFSGTLPLVCCAATVTTPPPPRDLQQVWRGLQGGCGDPERTVFNLPIEFPPDFQPVREGPDGVKIAAGIGGRPAEQGKWPWMVLLGRWSDQGALADWFCGGTLLTHQHVLTAAHCVRGWQRGRIGARLGEHDLRTTRDVVHQDRNISVVASHRDYRGSQNDIALLTLAAPVEQSEYIRPICLPLPGADHTHRPVEMAGFGRLEFLGDTPDVLTEVPLVVVDEQDCERSYNGTHQFPLQFPGGFQGTKVCAASADAEARDACSGDSGGPLMASRPNSDLYELVGVVSTGVGCGNPDFPGIYTKVSAYIDWILEKIIDSP